MRHAVLLPLLAAVLVCAVSTGSRADEIPAPTVPQSSGDAAAVIRAIERLSGAAGSAARVTAFRLEGDIQLQVHTDGKESLAAFRRAFETDPTVLAYLARDEAEVVVRKEGERYAHLELPAAEGSTFVPGRAVNHHDAHGRILELARQAKLTVNPDLWKRSDTALPSGEGVVKLTLPVIAWGAAERDFANLVAKDPLLHVAGAVERDARASLPHAIVEEPSITIAFRIQAR